MDYVPLLLVLLLLGCCIAVFSSDVTTMMPCTGEFHPVCARDGDGLFKTFNSNCDLEMYQQNNDSSMVLVSIGECSEYET